MCEQKIFFLQFQTSILSSKGEVIHLLLSDIYFRTWGGINEKTGHIKRQCISAFLSILETLAGRQVQLLEGTLHCQRCCSIHRTTEIVFDVMLSGFERQMRRQFHGALSIHVSVYVCVSPYKCACYTQPCTEPATDRASTCIC